MQLDFHYYAIAVLARAAGFHPQDALTIAYASQYTDDAVATDPLRLGDTGLYFDPVCTAHALIPDPALLTWNVQKDILIPFHFLPPERLNKESSVYGYVTQKNSRFSKDLLNYAAREKDFTRRLCAIGLALHVVADTWSHHGFSGRIYQQENCVDRVEVIENKPPLRRFAGDATLILPPLGHAQVGDLPDPPYCRWKYKVNGEWIERSNPKDYLQAARTIYLRLRRMRKDREALIVPWKDIEADIKYLLATPSTTSLLDTLLDWDKDLERRCRRWQDRFGADKHFFKDSSLKYAYDKTEWQRKALAIANKQSVGAVALAFDWLGLKRDELKTLTFKPAPNFTDSEFVQFHRAAQRHRYFVQQNMPLYAFQKN